jgi:hypothetical protein
MRAITNLASKPATRFTKQQNVPVEFINTSDTLVQPISPNLTTNSTLYNMLHVLRTISQKNPTLYGFGSLGIDDAFRKLKTYKLDKVAEIGSQPLYFATLDLEKCYDNLNTAKLYNLISALIEDFFHDKTNFHINESESEDFQKDVTCLLQKYTICHYIPSLEKSITRKTRIMTTANDLKPCIGNVFRNHSVILS